MRISAIPRVPELLFFAGLGFGKTYHLASTRIARSASGDVDLSKDKNGNREVSLHAEHLAKWKLE